MSEKAIKNRLNLMWQCKPTDPRIAKVKGFQEFNLLHSEVQELKRSLYHNPKYKWAHRYCSADIQGALCRRLYGGMCRRGLGTDQGTVIARIAYRSSSGGA